MRQKLQQYELLAKFHEAIKRKIAPATKAVDVLPADDVDFAPYFEATVPDNLPTPAHKERGDLTHYYQVLRFEARGKREIVPLNMLMIAYLRRDTIYTARARLLFERLWSEHTEDLLDIIPTRDLISTLRTFGDHSEDNTRRLLAKLGFTYAHLIKLYETERVNEGLPIDKGNYEIPSPNPPIGLDALWGVRFGGDNSFEIQNVILAEEIMTEPVIGPILLSLLTRFQNGDTIFSRFDEARQASAYKLETERNWSFGFKPFGDLDEGH